MQILLKLIEDRSRNRRPLKVTGRIQKRQRYKKQKTPFPGPYFLKKMRHLTVKLEIQSPP